MLNHSRLHNRQVHQRSNLHVSTCQSHSLSQKLPLTLTSTIRKSHGGQDRRESVHWPIEHQRLLPNQWLPQPQSLNLSLYNGRVEHHSVLHCGQESVWIPMAQLFSGGQMVTEAWIPAIWDSGW